MNQSKPVVVLMGHSGAGKDTVAAMLKMLDDSYYLLKFASHIKREVEQRLILPVGFCEHRAVKASGVGELLIELYHATKDVSSQFKLGSTQRTIDYCHSYGLVPVVTDCRNLCESQLVRRYDVYPIWVLGGEAKSSDCEQDIIWMQLTHDRGKLGYLLDNTKHDGLARLLFEVEALHAKLLKV